MSYILYAYNAVPTTNLYILPFIDFKVVVDDYGTADCEGHIYYREGDDNLGFCHYIPNQLKYKPVSPQLLHKYKNLLSFCGYFTCTGEIKLTCTMNIGCHGA